jgi:hypothetical protein
MGRPKGFNDANQDPDARCHGKQYRLRPSLSKRINEAAARYEVSPADFIEYVLTKELDSGAWDSIECQEVDRNDSDDSDYLEDLIEAPLRPRVRSRWLTDGHRERVADMMMANPSYSEFEAICEIERLNKAAGYPHFRSEKIIRNLHSFERESFPYELFWDEKESLAVCMADLNLTEEQAYRKLGFGRARNSPTRAMPITVKTANKKRHKVSR